MAWWYLLAAGLFEVCWVSTLKSTHGFTRFWPSLVTMLAIVLSMGLLAHALRTIPMSSGYAIWTGIGILGSVLLGTLWFGEPLTTQKSFFLVLTAVGIIGLKASTEDQRLHQPDAQPPTQQVSLTER